MLFARVICNSLLLLSAGSTLVPMQAWGADRAPTENDYFANVPVVLTASRLDQPLNEAPGALTVIDRQDIRRSGARTVAEVMRLVPGYLYGGWNGANPNAYYHVTLDDYGSRNLVLIDGRAAYSSLTGADTHRVMMDVMLEDIERIEVLRGANSAAYGANAMFGVINIITRHSADTVGAAASLRVGNNGVSDQRVRLGWGDEIASVRLSAGQQRDRGYVNAYDNKRLTHLDARFDYKPNLADDFMVSAGVSHLSAGDGFVGDDENPPHTIHTRDSHVSAEWRRQLNASDELKMSANYVEDARVDRAHMLSVPDVALDYSGVGRRVNVEAQLKSSWGDQVRSVLGVGYKDERALSKPIYFRDDWLVARESRAFGTVEWRVHPQWLLNGGLFMGEHSQTGAYQAPRVMLNWLASPAHTFRMGMTESMRAPGLFESHSDVRYFLNGVLVAHEYAARGGVKPERLKSQEIGYLGRFPSYNATIDVRWYRERMTSFIRTDKYIHPETGFNVRDYFNRPGLEVRGLEYQLRWKPWARTEIWWNQNYTELLWDDNVWNSPKRTNQPPRHATTVAWFQQLPERWEFSVIHQRLARMAWRDHRDLLPPTRRTDVRLARDFRLGVTKAELALTVQAVEGSTPIFLTRKNFQVPRTAFLTFRLEY